MKYSEKNKLIMKDLPDSERPYERCIAYGPSVLSDAELLAVILQSGSDCKTATELSLELLDCYGFDSGLASVCNTNVEQLRKIRGIGKVKAVKLQVIGELSRRIAKTKAKEALCMDRADTIAGYYMEQTKYLKKEQVIVMYLDSQCRLIRDTVLSVGTVRSSVLSPREVFIDALHFDAVYIILLHNHPSGDPTPSSEDFDVTDRLKGCGKMLGIELLDHIVLGMNCYYSFAEHRML